MVESLFPSWAQSSRSNLLLLHLHQRKESRLNKCEQSRQSTSIFAMCLGSTQAGRREDEDKREADTRFSTTCSFSILCNACWPTTQRLESSQWRH